jgi:hypothetical protein
LKRKNHSHHILLIYTLTSHFSARTQQNPLFQEEPFEEITQVIESNGGSVETPSGSYFFVDAGVAKKDVIITLKTFKTPHPDTDPRIMLIGQRTQVDLPIREFDLFKSQFKDFALYSPSYEEGHQRRNLAIEIRVQLPNGKSLLYLDNYLCSECATSITQTTLESAFANGYPKNLTVSIQPVDMSKVLEDLFPSDDGN